jgi:phosphatidylinositol alpha-1,6-mannosyltransferase
VSIVHLTASPFLGGPERQMLGLARATPASARPVFLCFAEEGKAQPFMQQLRGNGIQAIELMHNMPRLDRAMREVAQHLRRLDARALLCHGYKPDIVGYFAARRAGVPVIAVSRGWTWATPRVRVYEWLDRRMLCWADHVVCVSEQQAVRVRAAGVRPQRVSVIRNAIDVSRFHSPRQEARARLAALFPHAPRHIVLAAGRLSPEKGFGRLIEAARRVRELHPDTGFVLVGEGPLREPLRQQIDAAGLSETVLLAGFRNDLDSLLPGADLLVQSSYTEGMPNVVLEAMAAGLPCVAARASGSRELIADGVTGCLYEPDDAAALGVAIRRVLSPEGHAMGMRGRLASQRRYSIAAVADGYEALYAHLLGRTQMPLLLMITELFLPTKGGTAVMFEDDCRRLGGAGIHVVTAAVPGDAEFDLSHPNTIHRLNLRRYGWLRPESLALYVRLFATSLKLALKNRFAAVLAGRALPEGLVAWATGRLRGSKVVIYAHGEELTGWGRGRKFQTMCFALRHADAVLANSDFTRNTLVSLIGVQPERITMAYPVVDAERFRPGLRGDDLRASIGLGSGQKLILSVGRLQRRKGFDHVVRALPGLVARGIDVHHAIVGIGEDWEYLERTASELGVRERLHLLGHVEPDDLPRWYNACDLFAMPNRDIEGDTEGFGIVYLEANACAKPAVAGITGGTGSAVEDGLNGLRVDGDSVPAVEAGLARLLQDPMLAQRLGQAGRKRVMAGFTPQQRVALIRRLVTS